MPDPTETPVINHILVNQIIPSQQTQEDTLMPIPGTPIALLAVLGVPIPGDKHPLGLSLHHLQHPGYEGVYPPGPDQHPLPPEHQLPRHPALLTEQDPPPEVLSRG